MRVLFGLLIWSLAEISALVVVGGWIGLAGVLVLVLGTGVAGVMVLRRQGVRLSGAMRGQAGLREAGEAGLVALGAVLLILPGILTDLAGLVLMLPPVRQLVMGLIGARVVVQRQSPDAAQDVIEAKAIDVTPKGPSGWTKP